MHKVVSDRKMIVPLNGELFEVNSDTDYRFLMRREEGTSVGV